MGFETGHALLIGIGTYAKTARLNAPITAQDASAVAEILRDPQYCGYPDQQVRLLHDADATRDTILQELDSLGNRTTTESTVILFYSGHGDYGTDGYYLTTHETEIQDRKVAAGTGIRADELLIRLRKVPARRMLLIFNACHSGALTPTALGEEDSGVSLPGPLTTALLGTGEGRVVITACREDQKSYFLPDSTTTLFAHALLDGLRGQGVNNRRGYISVFDLYDYIFMSVSGEVKRRWQLTQEPELTILKGVGAMAVTLFRGKTTEGQLEVTTQPAPLGGAVREVDESDSARTLEQILSGQLNLAAGRDISGNTITGRDNFTGVTFGGNYISGKQANIEGDQIDARGSQGVVNQPGGRVHQVFGEQRTINRIGGDYAEGNIDRRRGAFIEGGHVDGPVVGYNEGGTVTFNLVTMPSSTTAAGVSLQAVHQRVQQAIAQAQQQGASDLASELSRIEEDLRAALGAEREGNSAQQQRRLSRAQRDLANLAEEQPELKELASALHQVK